MIFRNLMPRLRHRMTGFGTVQAPASAPQIRAEKKTIGSRRSRGREINVDRMEIFGGLYFLQICLLVNLKDPK